MSISLAFALQQKTKRNDIIWGYADHSLYSTDFILKCTITELLNLYIFHLTLSEWQCS